MNTDAGYRIAFIYKKKKYTTLIVYKEEKEAWKIARQLSNTPEHFNITVVWADTKIPTTTYAMLSKKNG